MCWSKTVVSATLITLLLLVPCMHLVMSYVTTNKTMPTTHTPSVDNLVIVDKYWIPEDVYPGTTGASLVVLLENKGLLNISRLYLKLCLPEGFEPNIIRKEIYSIGSGETISIMFNGIDISPSLSPGYYTASLYANYSSITGDNVVASSDWNTSFKVYISSPTPPNTTIIDTGFIDKIVYNSSRFGDIYVTIQNNDVETITSIVAKLYLPPSVRTIDNRSYAISFYQGLLGFGDIVSLFFQDINVSINPNELEFTVELRYTVSYRGAEYQVVDTKNFTITLPNPEKYLLIVNTRALYNGEPAVVLPTAKGVVYEVALLNIGPSTIKTITPYIDVPEGIIVRDISLASYQGVATGGIAVIRITLDVSSDIKPGTYTCVLKTLLVVQSGDTLSYIWEENSFPVTIAEPAKYKPRLEILNAFWGSGEPSPVYSGERIAHLYVEIYNYGRYPADDAIVSLLPLNSSVDLLEGCSVVGLLVSGGIARPVFTIDLREVVDGRLGFTVNISYAITLYGAYIRYYIVNTIWLKLPVFEAFNGYGLEVVSVDWVLKPVFPNTENASLTVRLVNKNPFTILGVNARLYLPQGFNSRNGSRYCESYVSGPYAPLQPIETVFTVTVGNIEPGVYNALLKLDYILQTTGYKRRIVEYQNISIQVHDPINAVSYVDSYWLYESVASGSYGEYLVVVLKNNMFPVMKGVAGEITLPDGILFTHTNSSKAVVYPYRETVSPIEILSLSKTSVEDLLSYLKKYTGISTSSMEIPSAREFSKGDYIVFYIPVHILSGTPIGFYSINISLEFIDHYECNRRINVSGEIGILGNIRHVVIDAPREIYVKDLSKPLKVTIRLYGEGVIHNTYLVVYTYMPLVMPSRNMFYLGSLRAPSEYNITINFIYNPLYTSMAPVSIRFGSIPLFFTLIYTDQLGYRHVVNTSSIIILEPYIKLSIRDLKAVERDGIVKVSGTIVNTGSATAERVCAKLYSSNTVLETFIGDIDPGSEVTFSIEGALNTSSDKAFLVISFYNAFDREYNYSIEVSIVHEEVSPELSETQPVTDYYTHVIIAAVIVFLAITGVLIYKTLKRHSERLASVE